MSKRSFSVFVTRLNRIGLRERIEKRALKHHVSLEELYEGGPTPSVIAARKDVYTWLTEQGKGINEIARLFDRAHGGVSKLASKEAS